MPGIPERLQKTFATLRRITSELQEAIETGEFYALPRAARRRKLRVVRRLYSRLAGPVSPRVLLGGLAAGVLFVAGCFQPVPVTPDPNGNADPDPDPNPDPDPSTPVERFVPNFSTPALLNQYGMGLLPGYDYAMLQPVFADIDGDGDTDLLFPAGGYGYYYEYFSDHLALLWEEGSGSFSTPAYFGLPRSSYSFNVNLRAMADLDGDGDLDAVLSGFYSSYYEYGSAFGLMVSYNSGDAQAPVFDVPVDAPFVAFGGYYADDATFADIDGDGDLDMLALRYAEGKTDLAFSLNNGTAQSPVFLAPMATPHGDPLLEYYKFHSVEALDIDNDGDFDLVVGAYFDDGISNGPRVLFYENKGTAEDPAFADKVVNPFGLTFPGTFSWGFPSYAGGLGIAAADLDGDGDLDLVVGPYSSYVEGGPVQSTFLMFRNTGSVQAVE